jgi:polysaccharide biosynthesis protein PslG
VQPTPRLHIRALFLTLAFAIVASFVPAAAHAAEKGVDTDLTSGIGWKKQDRTVSGVRDIGAEWVRLRLSWADVEQSEGSYSGLDRYDTGIGKAADSGARILLTVGESPAWASNDPQDYANFMRYAATRWGDKVDAWEIWNEENVSQTPADYARLLKAAYPAVKIADPSALVVYGGVAHNDYRFVEQSYAAEPNLGDYYDVMGTHSYPDPANASPALKWLDDDGRLAPESFSAYREIRAVMLARGDDKPLWLTEFGWATTSIADVGVSEATQAAYLTLAMHCLEQDPYVQVAIWHTYRNSGSSDTWNDQLGLVRSGFSQKLAYDAFKSYSPGSTGCAYHLPPPPPPPPAPDPVPEPAPEPSPEPSPAPEPEPEPSEEPQSDVEGADASSDRRDVEMRLERLGGARRVRMRVKGEVSNTHRGRIDLRVTCRARGDSDWRLNLTRKLDLDRSGDYATVIRPRRRAACRMRASYYAFGTLLARSPILRFKT